jgi:hypothetical protein
MMETGWIALVAEARKLPLAPCIQTHSERPDFDAGSHEQ